jgi:hypothetical protein
MSVSAVLGTVIGLVFVFALVSLFCSALTEFVSNQTERRARYLLTGLRSMLDQEEAKGRAKTPKRRKAAGDAQTRSLADDAPSPDDLHRKAKVPAETDEAAEHVRELEVATKPGDLTLGLFGHPLIRSLQTRRVRPGANGAIRNPQYIPPKLFAQALVDTLLPKATPRDGGEANDKNLLNALHAAVIGLDDRFPAKRSLLALLSQAQGDLTRFEESLEGWYDAQMGPHLRLVQALVEGDPGGVRSARRSHCEHRCHPDRPRPIRR